MEGGVRRLARHTLIYGVSSLGARLLNALVPFLYVNRLPPEAFGTLSDLYSWVAYPLVVLTFGMETAFFRFAPEADPDKPGAGQRVYNAAFQWVNLLNVAFGAAGLLLLPLLSAALGYSQQPHLVAMCVLIVMMDVAMALPRAKLRYDNRARWFATTSIINVGLTLVLNLVFVLGLGLGITYIFLANVIASAVTLGLVMRGNLPTAWRPNWAAIAALRPYGGILMVAGLLGMVNEVADRNLIPALWPDGKPYAGRPRTALEMNGIYAAAYRLAMFIGLATQAFRFAAEPFFFKGKDPALRRMLMAKVFHYFCLAGLVAFLFIGLLAPHVMRFTAWGLLGGPLFRREYWLGAPVVPVLLLANLALGLYIQLTLWFKLTGQVRFSLLLAGVGSAITLAGNIIFVPWVGFWASAVTTLVCYLTLCVLAWRLGQRYYPIPYRLDRLLAAAGWMVGGYLAISWVGGRVPSQAVVVKVVLAAAFTLALVGYEYLRPWQPGRPPHTPPANMPRGAA